MDSNLQALVHSAIVRTIWRKMWKFVVCLESNNGPLSHIPARATNFTDCYNHSATQSGQKNDFTLKNDNFFLKFLYLLRNLLHNWKVWQNDQK